MDFVIEVLESEKKKIEAGMKQHNLMAVNMPKARLTMANIAQLKQAIKLLRAKQKSKMLNDIAS